MPVSAATGDNQASVCSTIADENNILLGVGTGSQISLLSNKILHEKMYKQDPVLKVRIFCVALRSVGAELCTCFMRRL